ncbi:MAG: DUF4911 domain-containing protein [Veillonellaceae bacterium]|jgi:hypothetical protein|nr:DUF4911 domain-containing protein [Veillonellaceae bacterium]
MNDIIHVRLDPTSINYVNRIMEGYEYLGVVTTVDRKQGIVAIRVTPDTYNEVKKILANLPIVLEYI